MSVKIKFLGAAQTVTGSKYLIDSGNDKLLVDCGIFQGSREWRDKNWSDPPFNAAEIKAVLITHSHIDHIGFLPRLLRYGLNCPIYATPSSCELAKILLIDSAKLQAEEAAWRTATKRSRHPDPQPLYTEQEAENALKLFQPVRFGEKIAPLTNSCAVWLPAGHILGAAWLAVEIAGRRLIFSGDLGRYQAPILNDPFSLKECKIEHGDFLAIESTYGNRLHSEEEPATKLADTINRTAARGGAVIIPSFALGRAQTILYYLRQLKFERKIPNIPVIVDSPMALDASKIYASHTNEYDDQSLKTIKTGALPFIFENLRFVRTQDESKDLNKIDAPMIIISASGMLSGGRILHHLYNRVGDPRNTILFVGYQPEGGRGDWILKGAKSLTLFGEEVAIRAEIAELSGLSAHADRAELLTWAKAADNKPRKVAVTHGDPASAIGFAKNLKDELGWQSNAPKYLEEWDI
ncbi:MAG TPA: MBL fold metallo-hydrolase [Oligoflexia bacterium]|nr:MBL fold metallo-hydrolase [Oligoflexia bacterium]HMP27769.1 MBL fold metallo-hydrolase [Oligoflexia bacterium]